MVRDLAFRAAWFCGIEVRDGCSVCKDMIPFAVFCPLAFSMVQDVLPRHATALFKRNWVPFPSAVPSAACSDTGVHLPVPREICMDPYFAGTRGFSACVRVLRLVASVAVVLAGNAGRVPHTSESHHDIH